MAKASAFLLVIGYFPNFDRRNKIRMLTKIGQGVRE